MACWSSFACSGTGVAVVCTCLAVGGFAPSDHRRSPDPLRQQVRRNIQYINALWLDGGRIEKPFDAKDPTLQATLMLHRRRRSSSSFDTLRPAAAHLSFP